MKCTYLLVIAMLLSPLFISAQNWCAPGAKWTYEAGLGLAGYQQLIYAKDSVIGNDTAQVLDRFSMIQFPLSGPPLTWSAPANSYQADYFITKTDADVVYKLYAGVWDTLYWFGASIGDYWNPPHINDTSCAPLTVADTGSTVFNGVATRWLEISGSVTIYERLGSTLDFNLTCPNQINDGPWGMRCYEDADISVNFTSYGCYTSVGIAEESQELFSTYPSPATDILTINLRPLQAALSLRIFDSSGRLSLQQELTNNSNQVAISSLRPGLFVFQLTNSAGEIQGSGTFIKE